MTRQEDVMTVSLSLPTSESTLDTNAPTLVWNSDTNADSYKVQLSIDSFSTTLIDSSLTDTTLTTPNLAFNSTYQWRVKAVNSVSESDWSDVWTFKTRVGDVSTVNLLLPSNGSVLDYLAPIFTWQRDQNASSYDLHVSNDNFASTLISETLSDTTFQSTDLENGKTYQWRVRSKNAYGESDWKTYTFDIPTITSISDELPTQTTLSQNYPNPFNPTTQIQYSLAEVSIVLLEVYNMNGERIAELERGRKNAGSYSVTFNAANLPSGMYVYRLTANSQVLTRKMLLIK
jgi:hypothetical protein